MLTIPGAWTGCSDGTGPEDGLCPADLSTVTLTATVGGSVVFDWSPACPVAAVLVEEAQQGSDVWWISTAASEQGWGPPASANTITPPVTYGQDAEGLYFYGPRPLIDGTRYNVAVFRVLPAGSTAACLRREGAGCLLGVSEFTWQVPGDLASAHPRFDLSKGVRWAGPAKPRRSRPALP